MDSWHEADLLVTRTAAAMDAVHRKDTKAALYAVADIRDQLTELATALVEDGIKRGMSQAEIARCMDVPASVLRGAKREFAA